MRRIHLLSTAALAAAVLATPALAQQMRGDQPLSDRVAPLPAQQQAARQAEGSSMGGQREVMNLLQQADRALSGGNWARANELVERAQTTMLNAHAMGGGSPQGANMSSLSEAGRAISGRNRGEAQRALQQAMSDVSRVGGGMGGGGAHGDMNTGSGPGSSMPMQGGSAGMMDRGRGMQGNMGGGSPYAGQGAAGGSTMMQDQGMGGRTMSRADAVLGGARRDSGAVIRAQAGGGDGGGGGGGMPGTEQSGGLQGSSPGSPGAGTRGSTPSVLPTTPQQPGQTSALPADPTMQRGAPPPGSGGIGVGTTGAGTSIPPGTSGSGTTQPVR